MLVRKEVDGMEGKMNTPKSIPMTEKMVDNIYNQINDKRTSFAEMTRQLIQEALNNRESKKEVKPHV
jgi:hypothetical protein